ncbi:MAG: tRNA pseudouridine(38-40) synthase TruA, partial [Oscillospiraceae bacterium]
MKNIALRLRYTGTAYHGWQVQKNAATVQGTLEAAISKTVEHPVRLIGCGRTDAGVHARDYVANFH